LINPRVKFHMSDLSAVFTNIFKVRDKILTYINITGLVLK
jgi:hypothetical protein